MDTHVHLAAAMNKKQLLRFIVNKIENEPEEKVKADKTLGQVVTPNLESTQTPQVSVSFRCLGALYRDSYY